MDYQALLELIEADPALMELAEVGNCIGIAAALNEPTIAASVPFQLTTIKVLDVLGPTRGTVVMMTLRQVPGFGEIVKLMDQIGAGVNLNHPDSDAMFAQLVGASILTQPESDAILGLRTTHVGVSEHELGQTVSHTDVAIALESRDA